MTFEKICILGLTLVVMASCHVSRMKDYEFLRGPTFGIEKTPETAQEAAHEDPNKKTKFLSLNTENTASHDMPKKFNGLRLTLVNTQNKKDIDLADAKQIYISVYREADLSDIFVVNEDGILDYPLIGKVNVKGLTEDGIAKTLTEKLKGDYLINPHVIVHPVSICRPDTVRHEETGA